MDDELEEGNPEKKDGEVSSSLMFTFRGHLVHGETCIYGAEYCILWGRGAGRHVYDKNQNRTQILWSIQFDAHP
jgi:hypothetical protein